ncbi:MAG: MarR family transcriptional regulator [Kaiparowitsia implicata GSE-PSE-MK54-09C]|jgi:DNA-binding MarR family transcriptional regulator|nr:MarR family transcriptional regulator [Kaiparowitsia implicata GSE-PSE-MK54-09C]
MEDERTLNLLGAVALGLVDVLAMDVTAQAGHGGEAPAALVTLGAEPGLSINALRQILNLSHPGTVRLVDRLEADDLVQRRAGSDGRTLALFLTEAGRDRRSAILSARRQSLNRAMQALSPGDRQHLAHLLETLLSAMTTSEQRAFALCRLCDEAVCPSDRCPVEQRHDNLTQP